MFQRIKEKWLRWKRERHIQQIIEESGGKPKTLAETYPALTKILKEEGVAEVHKGSEKDMCRFHHGLGMWLRNNWDLWKGGPLAQWFKERGIHHADDMSGIILTSYYRQLKGQPVRFDEQVEHYRKYWAEHGVDPDTLEKKDS